MMSVECACRIQLKQSPEKEASLRCAWRESPSPTETQTFSSRQHKLRGEARPSRQALSLLLAQSSASGRTLYKLYGNPLLKLSASCARDERLCGVCRTNPSPYVECDPPSAFDHRELCRGKASVCERSQSQFPD